MFGRVNSQGQFIDQDGSIWDTITLDFESYYDSKFSLQKLTYAEYILDPIWFKLHGVGIIHNNDPCIYYPRGQIDAALLAIDWDNVVLIGQNLMYDASVLAWHYQIIPNFAHDIKNFSRAIYPGQKADLEVMLRREYPNDPSRWKGTELASFKGVWELNANQQEVMGNYCCQDCDGTRLLWQDWIGLMPYNELTTQHRTLMLYLKPKFEFDEALAQQAMEQEKQEEADAVKAAGVNKTTLSSNPKFKALLESMGIRVPRKISPRTGEVTDALAQSDPELIRVMADHPEHAAIWNARKQVKSTGMKSRAQRMIDLSRAFDGMLPIPLNYAGAHTLRWSGAQKVNPQNLKRGSPLRHALRAPKGFLVYVIDSSNIEARMIAWLANELAALDLFRQGADTYDDMATKIYGYAVYRKYEDENGNLPYDEEGKVGKTAKLGLGFGMGDLKFQNTLASGPMGAAPIYKPLDFCTNAVDVFRRDNPNIVSYWAQLQRVIYDMMMPGVDYYLGPVHVEHQHLRLPNGLALYYPNIRHEEVTRRQLIGERVVEQRETNLYCDRKDGDSTQKLYGGIVAENITQRASRDVVAEQLLEAEDHFQDIQLALSTHDEGAFLMPDDHPDQRLAELNRIFCTPPAWCSDLPLAAEGSYGEVYDK